MSRNRRIFVSAPRDIRLDEKRNQFKCAILKKIKDLNYEPQVFLDRFRGSGLPAGKGWNLQQVDQVMKRCIGAVLIGVRFTETTDSGEERWLPSDYCQYEGAVARACRLPTLAIAAGIKQRILFQDHEPNVVSVSLDDDSPFETDEFKGAFEQWESQLDRRRDAFVGFCSKSAETADKLIKFLTKDLSVTVMDWRKHFSPGSTILEQIEQAATRCSTGVFLFTRDDLQSYKNKTRVKVPRDNVVFEAGYFNYAKGNDRVLIIQEEGAKMPSDLGGKILLTLSDKKKIDPIKDRIRAFFDTI